MADGVTVQELCALVGNTLDGAFPDELWVKGAIKNIKRSQNGHVYFDLVDPAEQAGSPNALLPVTLFANDKFRVNAILKKAGSRFKMSDGTEVLIRGRVGFYSRQGRVQLRMSYIDPNYTLGQLEAERAALLAELERGGLLARNGELPLSIVPLRVAIVTSRGSAAEADIVDQLERSGFPFEITVLDARVQGEEAVQSIVAAIERAGEAADTFDVVTVVRGGGARTDLVAFDHRDVAVAIATCPLPVLVGIGHEIDRSVADEVAAVSTKTPTACAAFLIDRVARFGQQVDNAAERIAAAAARHVGLADQRLVEARHRVERATHHATSGHLMVLERSEQRLRSIGERWHERATGVLREAELRTRALDPAVALARGWSVTRDEDGNVVRAIDDVAAGTVLRTQVANGVVTSTVSATERSEITLPTPPEAAHTGPSDTRASEAGAGGPGPEESEERA